MNHRDFLFFAASAAVATALPLPAHAHQLPRTLWIARDNPQDGLVLDISTANGIAYLQYLLRDVRANRQGLVHPQIVSNLAWVQAWLGHWGLKAPIVATSGLRTEVTNREVGGAHQSQHLPDNNGVFRAVDFWVPGANSEDVARMLEWARTGGVGFYRSSKHIHLDAGRPRSWGLARN